MSFVYNQKEVFRGCSTKSVNLTLSNKLANFYLNNSNPNRQDLEQFCKEADFDFNSAVSYIKERKMQDIRNRNLVFMKFGREYIQPSTEQVQEYENSLTSGDLQIATEAAENQNVFKKLLNKSTNLNTKSSESEKDSDLLLDEIPKKTQTSSITKADNTNEYNRSQDFIETENTIKINKKQKQFHNQKTSPIKQNSEATEGKSKTTKSAAGSTDNSDSEALSSSASLGRLFNNYYQHSFLPSGIQDTKLIHSLILFMKKDLKLELKHEVSITLARTSNALVLQRFLEFEGAEILSNWLHEIKEKIQDLPNNSASGSQNYLNNILLNLLIFCEKLKISLKDLKFSKIGKEVNKLAKLNLNNKEIHGKCVALVNKWKKIVEETKEGKKLEAAPSSGFESAAAAAEKNDLDEKTKKADFNQSLLKGISNDEAGKPAEKPARGVDTEQDRVANEFLNRKKYHPEKDEKRERERDRDRLRERDREETGLNAHDKNNKKFKREESNFDFENQKRKERETQQQQQNVTFDSNRNIINKSFIPNQPMANSFVYNTIPLGTPIQNPVSSAVPQKKGPLKGILKTSQSTNQPGGALKKDTKKLNTEKKRIKFEHDMVLEKVKIFKLTDEVNAPNISEEEYQKIQQELLKDPTRSFLGDMKVRESHMEKENLLREKEKAKIAKEMFEKMTPEIKITRPLEIYIESPYEEGEEIDKELVSEEKEQIDQFLNKILMTTYFRESDIPPTPKMGKSEMFEFFDENIPKIENLKKSFDSEKPIYEVDFSKIEHIESNPELLKSLAERINNAELSIQSEEEKNKLLAILQNQMKKTEESSKVGANTPINSLMTQLPNLLPSNAINPLNSLNAANMLNNMKINPNNIGNPMPPNIPNQIFPPIQPIGMGPIPIVPPYNQMNNMMNPNNIMNMNNMNLIKNNMNFPNNPNFNMPNNPNMMNNPLMKNMPNNMNMNNFNNRNQNNMMGPGNRMNMNTNFSNNNPNFNNDNRKNFNNQDNRQINFTRIKTKPCRNYHGPVGCPRGDDCYFIHDQENQGRDIPEARLAEIAKTNTENANKNNNNNINYNTNNQNNSFYNNNVQNNRFRNYRNFNNRGNTNFSNNRFTQNQQGNNPNCEVNYEINAKEESASNCNNNNPFEDNGNITMNCETNNENQNANESENNNFENNFNQDAMEIEPNQNAEIDETNKNNFSNSNENENGFEDEVNLVNYTENNNVHNKNFNSGFNNQNSFYNQNNNANNNYNHNFNQRNNGIMHHRNFHHRNFNGNRMNNYNKNMNFHNNNNNQNSNFPGQQHFNNQQQQYYSMMQQQNKVNGGMTYNNNQN